MNTDLKILITGAKGFVGKNLVPFLKEKGYKNLFLYDIDSTEDELLKYTKECKYF